MCYLSNEGFVITVIIEDNFIKKLSLVGYYRDGDLEQHLIDCKDWQRARENS